ncbi:hypothetical protein COY07_00820, partial [Candidatus Peregrinibacteria bacterium CG_4_10_14_0_2_um_filter_43_11]
TSGPPTAVIVKDNTAEIAARVLPGTGQIELLKDIYHLQALPASATLPTRVSIVENSVNQILANVYYVADENTDVTILPESISQKNIKSIGVTIGDANPNDDIIAATIPGYAPTYPGGAAIFNKTLPQINVALVNSDGAIRMMQEGYTLTLKNEGKLSERPIFQIINDAGKPIFDLYIHADFTSPIIRQNETWGDLFKTIGSLVPSTNHLLASLFSVSDTSHSSLLAQSVPINKATAASPFPDVSSASPQYKAILDLYKRHVISGYGDGLFRPNSKITRAEFIKIALGVTNCFDCTMPTDAQREKYTALAPFPDVKLPAWYYFCISIAKELKMITGYGDGFFRPERNISRAEAAAVLLRQSAIEIKKASEKSFLDVPDYAWYKDYVYTAVEIGLIPNHSGFIFPDEEITRAEFAFMGSGLLNIQECTEVDSDKDGMTDPWEMLSNLDPLNDTDAASDADRDHLTALQEFRLGTNPNSPDTDGDGIPDNKDSTPHGGEKPFGKTPPVGSTSETGSEVAPDQTEGQSSGQSQGTGQPTGGEQNPGETGSIGDTGATAGACPCINNPNQNDTDGDSLIDACDTDIDADTVSNLLCIFDASGIVSLQKQKESEDNCIFTQNPDQTDSDFDHIGDVCEFEDVCPPVPEDLDGIEDIDGCPDVVDKTADNPPGVYVNKGPLCYFLDYEADLMPGDVIMNAITDVETHSVIYQQSNQVNY